MQRLIIIMLIFSVLLPHGKRIGTLISFKINQDVIAETLCIERDRPESTCNGCCQLQKQIKADDQKEKQQPQPYNQQQTETVWICSCNVLLLCLYDGHKLPVDLMTAPVRKSRSPDTLFRPPRFCA